MITDEAGVSAYKEMIEREFPHQATLFKILNVIAQESREEGGSRRDMIFAMRDLMHQFYFDFDNDRSLLRVEASLRTVAENINEWIGDTMDRADAICRARAAGLADNSRN